MLRIPFHLCLLTCLSCLLVHRASTATAEVDTTASAVAPAEPQIKTTGQPERRIVGWVERIKLHPEGAILDAKLTPGSEGNVLHAEKIKRFLRKGERWIRFETQDRRGEPLVMERRIVDEMRFRTTDGSIKRRYLVSVGLCLDDRYMTIDFSLANRNAFEQEVRIGRDALAGQFVIDPAKTKTTQPKCVIPADAETSEGE